MSTKYHFLILYRMSLNKAAKSSARTYRERHQPSERSHLGLLEKKKDYKLRAKDYGDKQAVLKHLRQKALNKNPDEFYFHMVNSKTVDGGVHRDLVSSKAKSSSSTDQIRLMQTQDYKYVSMKRVMEQRKIERLKSTLHLLDVDSRPTNTHTLFVDNDTQKNTLDLADRLETTPEMLDRTTNRPLLSTLKSYKPENQCLKKQSKAYKQLSQRIAREKQLQVIEDKMKIRRELSHKKNKPLAVEKEESNDNAPIIKWQMERKR